MPTHLIADRSQVPGAVKAEVYVGQAYDRSGVIRWRWDITFYEIRPPRFLGENELGIQGRWHLGGDLGYCRTRLGAWWQVAKAYRAYPRRPI